MNPVDRSIRDFMSVRPTCIRPDERLDIAQALMTACRIRHLPVEDDGRVVGILALYDVFGVDRSHLTASRAERALHLRGVAVREVMTRPVITTDAGSSLLDAAQRLFRHHISALPATEAGRLVGIVTRTDFLIIAAELLDAERLLHDAPAKVERLMTPCPITTALPGDGLDLARSLLRALRVHHLPVLEDDHLVGLLSDLDLQGAQSSSLEALRPAERIAERHGTRVRDVMSTRVATVVPEQSAAEAARLLARRRIGCLPVLRAGRLTGILTVTDFLYYLLAHAPGSSA